MMTLPREKSWTWETPQPIYISNGFWLLAACDEFRMDFEVHEDLDQDKSGKVWFNQASSSPSPGDDPTEYSRVGEGFLKWDGCLQFSESFHVDLPVEAADFLDRMQLVKVLKGLAKERMDAWDA